MTTTNTTTKTLQDGTDITLLGTVLTMTHEARRDVYVVNTGTDVTLRVNDQDVEEPGLDDLAGIEVRRFSSLHVGNEDESFHIAAAGVLGGIAARLDEAIEIIRSLDGFHNATEQLREGVIAVNVAIHTLATA